MKLLGGIQSQFPAGAAQKNNGETASPSAPSERENAQSAARPAQNPPQSTATLSTDKHNVMADVISRHEQIVFRTKSRKN